MTPLLSIKQLAEYLGTTVPALYQARHRGELPPAVKVGRELKWRGQDVEAWLESRIETPRGYQTASVRHGRAS